MTKQGAEAGIADALRAARIARRLAEVRRQNMPNLKPKPRAPWRAVVAVLPVLLATCATMGECLHSVSAGAEFIVLEEHACAANRKALPGCVVGVEIRPKCKANFL